MRILLRIVAGLVLLLLLLIGLAHLTGNAHLVFGVRNTYLKGRTGPIIDERIYAERVVEAGTHQPWPELRLNTGLNDAELELHRERGTAAFLVVQADTLRYSYYDEEHGPDVPTNIWSDAKSIVSLLVGIAIDQGLIGGVDELLEKHFPQYEGSGITIGHLLSMSSGINFDESYKNPFGHQAKALYGDDLVALNEAYEPVRPPGQVFEYRGGNTILLSMVLRKVSGMDLADFCSRYLWSRIGSKHDTYWSVDRAEGLEKAFCCLFITAPDLARIGRLALHRGVWDNDTIVSPTYVENMVQPAPLKLEDGSENRKYGYHWWVLQLPGYQGFYARGLDGQFMVVLPEEELIMVRTGDGETSKRKDGHVQDMLDYIDMARRLVSAG